jgi:hypothetical protein
MPTATAVPATATTVPAASAAVTPAAASAAAMPAMSHGCAGTSQQDQCRCCDAKRFRDESLHFKTP